MAWCQKKRKKIIFYESLKVSIAKLSLNIWFNRPLSLSHFGATADLYGLPLFYKVLEKQIIKG
jgi:hypothetical protein